MSNYGYARVSSDAIVAFHKELNAAPWAAIDVTPYIHSQLQAPATSLIKLRLQKTIGALIAALATDSQELTRLDAAWDAIQRRIKRRIDDGTDSEDAADQEAAERLQEALLLGNRGLEQTLLSYEEEVTFGNKQLALLRSPKQPNTTNHLAEDAARLGVDKLVDELEKKTSAFATALEKAPKDADTSRYSRIKLATADCVDILDHSHKELEYQLHYSTPENQAQLYALLDSLVSLIPTKTLVRPAPVISSTK